MKMEYWTMCIEEALSDAEVLATDTQIKSVAEWVKGAHESHGEATGQHLIPDPINDEIKALTLKIEKMERGYERQLAGIAKGVAQRRGVSVTDVCIDVDGLVTYK
jgi:hypothetical protein